MNPATKWIADPPTGRLFQGKVPTPLGRVTWAGRHLRLPVGPPMRMRFWDTYAAVYILDGRGRFLDADGRNLAIGPGDLLLLFPRHGYCYHMQPKTTWSEFFIQFRGPVFDLWRRKGLISPSRPVHHLEPVSTWWRKLERLIEPSDAPEPAQSLLRVCRLQEFLIEALVLPRSRPPQARDRSWLDQAQTFLAESPGQPVDWPRLAERLGMTYDQFRKRFVALTGIPPAKYRAARVMEHAVELLRERHRPLKDIAAQCGFHDVFHFSRRFKQFTDLTPGQYRRCHQ